MTQLRIRKQRRARERAEDQVVELVRQDGNAVAERAEEWLHATEWVDQ